MQKNISVLVVASDNLEMLEKVIWSYNTQTFRNFEMLILNLNDNQEISKLVTALEKEVFFSIRFMKFDVQHDQNQALKHAVANAASDYIIITTGTCIARPDFVEEHMKIRVEGHVLLGKTNAILNSVAQSITRDVIYASDCFQFNWLRNKGVGFVSSFLISYSGLLNTFLDSFVTLNTVSFKNFSGWKSDLIQIESLINCKFNTLDKLGVKKKFISFRTSILEI